MLKETDTHHASTIQIRWRANENFSLVLFFILCIHFSVIVLWPFRIFRIIFHFPLHRKIIMRSCLFLIEWIEKKNSYPKHPIKSNSIHFQSRCECDLIYKINILDIQIVYRLVNLPRNRKAVGLIIIMILIHVLICICINAAISFGI